MNKLIHLHFASEYSFFESPTTIKEYVKFAKNNNINVLALTDHNFVFGYAEFRKECEKNNIKPIYGIDLDVEDFRLILLAKNNQGFNKIINLSYKKSLNQTLYLGDVEDENLIIINHPSYGCKNPEDISKKIQNFYFYDANNENSNIFINDNRIIDINQEEELFFINEIKGTKLNDFKSYLFSSEYDIKEELIQKTIEIASQCNISFENNQNVLPNVYEEDPNDVLLNQIKKSLIEKKAILEKFDKNDIKNRVEYEFNVIKKMNVSNYFLIISDLINWSRKNNIYIGPGRGSVSGSLIAYLIDITSINPLEYNLFFERFLNPERINMPDIDIDIQDDKREEVIQYLKDKYGIESVAQICTFQRMGAKQSLKDVGRHLNINFAEVNEISKLISGNDSLLESYDKNVKFKARIDSSEEYTKLFQLATKIESLPRQTGTHAAGIVLAKNKIINNCPIMDVDGNNVTQFSMEYLEEWNLLKIDLLGLRTLTIIKTIESEIKKTYSTDFSIDLIPLQDEKTNKLLSSGKVAGIFQLESFGMISTIEQVKINSFNDLVDIISMYRPGPMSNIPTYIQNKNNPELIKKIHPIYDQLVQSTNGIIIYQEQIMEIAQKVANLSFAQADILRRSISKKNKDEIEKFKSTFVSNAANNGLDKEVATQIYNQIEKFAEYGFNKSHAVAYATLSYKMAYLKAKFPICFYSTLISLVLSMDSVNKYVKEAKELKFNIESPMINKISRDILHNKLDTIWLPLTFIKGIGSAAFEKILREYEKNGIFSNFFDFVVRMKKINIGDTIIESLILSNALREFGNMKTLLHNKEKALNYSSVALYLDKNTNEMEIDSSISKPNLEFVEEDLEFESKNEIRLLGMIYNAFVTSRYETKDRLNNLKVGIEYSIVVYTNIKKEVINKYKKMTYILEISDSSGKETVYFKEKTKDLYDEIPVNSIGYVNIIKLDRNGKKYLNISKWKGIKNV